MSLERFRVKVPDERWFEENIGCENARTSCGKCHNPHIPTKTHADLARKG